MTRYIDADAIDKRYVPIAPLIDWGTVHYEWVAFIDDINELPTIDAVPVIRCKECKYRITANCERFGIKRYTQSDSFCSWAEPKEADG